MLYENEWILFIFSEALTWFSIIMLLITRYKFTVDRLSQLFLAIIILCTLFQALLVGIDFYFTGTISLFQVIIILFIIYASTLGSSDIQRLDQYLQHKIKKKRQIFNDDLYDYIYYKKQLFYIHTFAYISIHFIWLLIDSNLNINVTSILLFLYNQSYLYTIPNLFNNMLFNLLSYLWSIIYFFDISVVIFYSIWQRISNHNI